MTEAPISMRLLDVILKPITPRGFFVGRTEYAAKISPVLEQAAAMIASGQVHVSVSAVYPLSSIKGSRGGRAERREGSSGRSWTICLSPDTSSGPRRDEDDPVPSSGTIRWRKRRGSPDACICVSFPATTDAEAP